MNKKLAGRQCRRIISKRGRAQRADIGVSIKRVSARTAVKAVTGIPATRRAACGRLDAGQRLGTGVFTGGGLDIGNLFFRRAIAERGLVTRADIFLTLHVGVGDVGAARAFLFLNNYNFLFHGNGCFGHLLDVRNQFVPGDNARLAGEVQLGRHFTCHREFVIFDRNLTTIREVNHHLAIFDIRALRFA